MTEDRGAFKTIPAALRPISGICDVPSRPWRQSRALSEKRPSSFLHQLRQRILTKAEHCLRYSRIEPDS
jgi:hypothetical protein